MAGQVIAFPGVTLPQRKTTKRECRELRLVAQSRAGDIGATAELYAGIIRDAAAGLLPAVPLFYHDRLIGSIRKLRRQLEGLGKEGTCRQRHIRSGI
jgi:hypothetical protein